MKIIHKSVLKDLTITFTISLISLNLFLLMEKILRLSRFLSGVGASAADMLRIILYLQPQLMLLTIPMSLLLATLLTYGRLNADNELTALRVAGMPFRSISAPVLILGIASFFTGLIISFYVSPNSAVNLRSYISKTITQRAPMAIETGIFNTSFRDVVILVSSRQDNRMSGIFIYDRRKKDEPKVLIAKEGRVQADNEQNLGLYMSDGYIHIAKPEGSLEVFFERYNLLLNLMLEGPSRKNSEMTPFELLKSAGESKTGERVSFYLEFHRRLSFPALCLILMFLGPPLSLLSGRSGRFGGLTIGLSVFTAFYLMLIYGENMAKSGSIPHYIGAWAPVVITGICSLWAFSKTE